MRNTVSTVVALGGCSFVRVDVQSIVRTCLHTGLTAYTAVIVEIYNPIFTGKQSIGRADRCAGCVLTMVASMDAEFTRGIGVCSGLDVLDVGSIYTDGDVVLGLASHRTGVATNAGSIVDYKTIVDHLVTSHLER